MNTDVNPGTSLWLLGGLVVGGVFLSCCCSGVLVQAFDKTPSKKIASESEVASASTTLILPAGTVAPEQVSKEETAPAKQDGKIETVKQLSAKPPGELEQLQAKAATLAKKAEEAEVKANEFLKSLDLPSGDLHYVRACATNRIQQKKNANPHVINLDATSDLAQSDVGILRYPNRYLDARKTGYSHSFKVAYILAEDEMIIYPGYHLLRGVSTKRLTAGLKDGSRVDLSETTLVVDGVAVYTGSDNREREATVLVAVDFPVASKHLEASEVKAWAAMVKQLAEAERMVGKKVAEIQKAETDAIAAAAAASKPAKNDQGTAVAASDQSDPVQAGLPPAIAAKLKASGSKTVDVGGYFNKYGHYVAPHTRSAPGSGSRRR